MAKDEAGESPTRELGGADNDREYAFGRRFSVDAHWPFTSIQYARLHLLRIAVRDLLYGVGDTATEGES